jgi:diaminohydroxyphosphoribosylaminopyrimidine deaminase/5-amino-6-(5-phosphoribosylamino)uracil reductase
VAEASQNRGTVEPSSIAADWKVRAPFLALITKVRVAGVFLVCFSMPTDEDHMRAALRLARRGYGATSPNPMVGALVVKSGRVIGRGWHHRAGEPHAEIEAIRDARRRGSLTKGATLYVTLEPCSTQGRTPSCTRAILAAGITRVVAGATDPNPRHRGRAWATLRRGGVKVRHGVLAERCDGLNEAFNHWIVHRTPFVTVKAAMTLDGKIATASGLSKWITSEVARAYAMRLRQGADAILVGIGTVLADNPSLSARPSKTESRGSSAERVRRVVLDARARTPLNAKIVTDAQASLTTIVVSDMAPKSRVAALAKRVRVLRAPIHGSKVRGSKFFVRPSLNLPWLLKKLGSERVTNLLVEGGGEVNAAFLLESLAHRVEFFYAPKVLGGRDAIPAVGGVGVAGLDEAIRLTDIEWRELGPDLLLGARILNSAF